MAALLAFLIPRGDIGGDLTVFLEAWTAARVFKALAASLGGRRQFINIIKMKSIS